MASLFFHCDSWIPYFISVIHEISGFFPCAIRGFLF